MRWRDNIEEDQGKRKLLDGKLWRSRFKQNNADPKKLREMRNDLFRCMSILDKSIRYMLNTFYKHIKTYINVKCGRVRFISIS